MFENIIENVHNYKPLIHSITNYVSMNDCANILLASGGSAIMSEDVHEVEDITSLCSGLNINIGMLNEEKLEAMLLAGKKANIINNPVVLDPVGAGASSFRTASALRIMKEVRLSAIRGNISEIKALLYAIEGIDNKDIVSMGVEAVTADRITENNLSEVVQLAAELALKINTVICMTGVIDIVTDGNIVYYIRNGHPMMSKVTGAGCQLSELVAAYITANNDRIPEAAAAAVSVMGICGEIAYNRMSGLDGNASYRNYIIDAVYNMTDDMLCNMCKVEVMKYE